MADPVLQVSDLEVQFKTGRRTAVTVVRGVSFTAESGRTLCVVGESGCGKSVTASAIMGLLPKESGRISGGSVRLCGQELTTMTQRQLRDIRGNRIAMIFQEPMSSLDPVYTIESQMIEMIRACGPATRESARGRALELLKLVGIPEPERRMRQFPHQLSGGMLQRVMIAMALSAGPQVLIADEPTTALDVTIQAQVMELIRRLRGELDMAVILITHDMGIVAEMADDVLVMYAGQVVEYGGVREIFKNPRHPYTQRLLAALPRPDRDVDRLYTIEGQVPDPSEELPGCRFAPRCEKCVERCLSGPIPLKDSGGVKLRCVLEVDGDG